MPMFSEDRFGVELHAFYIQGFMSYPHDFVDVALRVLGPGGDFQAIRQAGLFDNQRVITRGGERVVQALEYANIIVING